MGYGDNGNLQKPLQLGLSHWCHSDGTNFTMATLRKRGDRWQVQVRRQGHKSLSKSFALKIDAERWARQIETDADRTGFPIDPRILKTVTVADLIRRYRDAVTPTKRGRDNETIILNALLRQSFAALSLSEVSPKVFANYRDCRLERVKPTTIRREMTLLQHTFELANREWGFPIENNPLKSLRRPQPDKPRDRRLEGGELEVLLQGCRKSRVGYLLPVIQFAIETGMRRGEITQMQWQDVDLDKRLLHIPITKTGYPRTIPLTDQATKILTAQPTDRPSPFTITPDGLRQAWKRLVRRVGLDGLHFHDLRHEAVSRFFEMGLSVPEVALISGHRDPRMLFRYTHLRAEDVGRKLQKARRPLADR